MKFEEIQQLEDTYELPVYTRFPISIEGGSGSHVWDTSGSRYLDLYGGHAVALTGHCHPHVVEAIRNQSMSLLFYSAAVYSSQRARLARRLVDLSPLERVFFCNSGSEANEAAIKLARKYTGRTDVIAFEGDFHGRTMGALSATWNSRYRTPFEPLVPGFQFATLGEIDSVHERITPETAAVIVEPIQSVAGVKTAPASFFQELRKLTEDEGVVLIFDEVQTGLGRTGKMWVGEHWDVTPDVITLAKAIASGVPMGAVLASRKVGAAFELGDHGSTFGGGPLACAAALATLDVIENEDLPGRARRLGHELMDHPGIEGEGMGLLVGLDCGDGKATQATLLEKKILVGTSSDSTRVRLMPPLTLHEDELIHFLTTWEGL